MRRMLLEGLARRPLTEKPPAADDAALAELAASLDRAARRRLGRSLAIREVDAGSCNGCELEIHALNNAFYDLERFGLRFVASPRHADVLLVTGPVIRRKGFRADQIGPLVAADTHGAERLLGAALSLGAGPVFLDVPDHQQSLAAILEALGFSVQRPFTRMALRRSTPPGDPARLFLTAGPEFG